LKSGSSLKASQRKNRATVTANRNNNKVAVVIYYTYAKKFFKNPGHGSEYRSSQNLIVSCLNSYVSLRYVNVFLNEYMDMDMGLKISWKFIHNFRSKLAHRPTYTVPRKKKPLVF